MPEISRLVIEVDSKGVLKAEGDLSQFQRILGKTGKDTDDLAKKFGAFQLIANRLPAPLKSIASGLMGISTPAVAAVSVFLDLTDAVVKFAKESVDAFARYETIKTNLTVVSASAEEAARTFSELQKFSLRTPFNLEQLSKAGVMLRQAGTSTAELIPILEALGNVSSGNEDVFNRMAVNLAQVANVGKASSIDMRQFLMAGIPITKMLEDIGKAGSTSFEDIKEAIMAASREGGRFEGAMAKGSQTITGMRTQIEGLKDQYKALWAEYSNIPDFVRQWYEAEINLLTVQNERLTDNIELRKIREKQDSGAATIFDEYEQAIIMVRKYQKELDALGTPGINYGDGFSGITNNVMISNAQKQLSIYNEIIARYQPMINAHNELISKQEEYNKLLSESQKRYNEVVSSIQEAHKNTAEGKIRALREEIAKFEAMRGTMVKTEEQIFRGTYQNSSGVPQAIIDTVLRNRSMTEKEASDLEDIIRDLYKQLENINKGSSNVKNNFADWVRLLSQATGYTEEQVAAMKGLETVERYAAEGIEAVMDRYLTLTDKGFIYELLGLGETDVYEDAAQKMQALVQMMTEARTEDPWSISDESYNRALELLEKYNATADNSRFQFFISQIEEERILLGKTINERNRSSAADKLRSAGINPTDSRIDQVISSNEQNKLLSITRQWQDIFKTSNELAIERLAIEEEISLETAKQIYGEQKQIDYIKHGRDISGEISDSTQSALEGIRQGLGGYVEYFNSITANLALQRIQGTNTGDFVKGFTQNDMNWQVGGIDSLVGAISEVVFSIEGVSEILSPITAMLKEFEDIIKSVLLPVYLVVQALTALTRGINWILNTITFGLFEEMADLYDSLVGTNDEREREEERIRALNEQYGRLLNALKEQEEYYLQQRRSLNSEFAIENFQTRQVNDMILSPNGAFSTNPRDFIIATKNPQELMGGGRGDVIIQVHPDNATVTATETTRADGTREIIMKVKGLIGQEIANGGMDNFFDAMDNRRQGKRAHS